MVAHLKLPFPGALEHYTRGQLDPDFVTAMPHDTGADLGVMSNSQSTWLQPGSPLTPEYIRIWFVDFSWTETATGVLHQVARQQIIEAWVDLGNAVNEARYAAAAIKEAQACGKPCIDTNTIGRVHSVLRKRLYAYSLVNGVIVNLSMREIFNETINGWVDLAFDRERETDNVSGRDYLTWTADACPTAGFYAALATPELVRDSTAAQTIHAVLDQVAASIRRPLVVVGTGYFERAMSEDEHRLRVQAAAASLSDAALDAVIDQLQLGVDRLKVMQTLRDLAEARRAHRQHILGAHPASAKALPGVRWTDEAAPGLRDKLPAQSSSAQPPTRSILLHRV